jgi:hypothetical protein
MCVLADKRGIACHYPDHVLRLATVDQGWQEKEVIAPRRVSAKGWELMVPNPKLKLLDQVREVLRIKHYAIRTQQADCDWIKRQVGFHQMRSGRTCSPERTRWSCS